MNLRRYRLKLTYHLRRMDIYMRRAILRVILYIIVILFIGRWAEFYINSQFKQTSCENSNNKRETIEWSNLWMTEKNDKLNENYFVSLSRSLTGQTLNRLQKLSLTPQQHLEIMAIRGILESYQEPANRKESSKLRMEIGHWFNKWKQEHLSVPHVFHNKTMVLQKVNAILNLYTIYSLRNMHEVADKCATILLEIRNALNKENKGHSWEGQFTNHMLASWVQNGTSLASLTSDAFDVMFIHHVFSAIDVAKRDSLDLSDKQIDDMHFVNSLHKFKSMLPSQLHQIMYYDLDEYNYDLHKWPTVANDTFASPSWLLLHRNLHLSQKNEFESVENTNNKENIVNEKKGGDKDITQYEVFQNGPVGLNNWESRYEDYMLNVWLLSLQETKSVLSKKKPEQILSRNKEKLRTHYDNVIVSIIRYLVRRIWSKDELPESVKSYLQSNSNTIKLKKKKRQWEEQDVGQQQQTDEVEKEYKINYTTVGMWVEKIKNKPSIENNYDKEKGEQTSLSSSSSVSSSQSEEFTTLTSTIVTQRAPEHNTHTSPSNSNNNNNNRSEKDKSHRLKEPVEREFIPFFDYSTCGFAATLARGARWNAHRYASRKNALIYNNEEILAVAESMASSCYLLWFTNIRQIAEQRKISEKEINYENLKETMIEDKPQTFVQGWEFDLFGAFRAITPLESLSHSQHESNVAVNKDVSEAKSRESACWLTNLLLRSFYELFETTWDTEYAEMAYHLLSRANKQCLPTSETFYKQSKIHTLSDLLSTEQSIKESNYDFVGLYLRNLRLFTLLVTRMECTMQRRSKSFCALPQYVILGEYDQLIPLYTFYGKHKY